MSISGERYRLYLDESGDHVLHDAETLAQPQHRYLALAGCWLAQGDAYLKFHLALDQLKQKHFPHSPDDPVILHRADIINSRGHFWRLREGRARDAFDADLCALVEATQFTLVGVCIDKRRMQQQYAHPAHPYHLALQFLLERYCGWLNHANRAGDLLVESRGKVEDGLLKQAYVQVWQYGTNVHDASFFRRVLTSKEAKFKKKSQNTAGLQLADLLAHPVRDDILKHHGVLDRPMSPFAEVMLRSLQGKYHRAFSDGRVEGWGKKLFPK